MSAVTRLIQFKFRAAGHNLFAESDKRLQHLPQIHQLRAAIIQCQHIGPEAGLQLRVAIKLIEYHIGHSVAFQFDNHAHTVAVAFIAQIGNALNGLVAHQFGDFLNH